MRVQRTAEGTTVVYAYTLPPPQTRNQQETEYMRSGIGASETRVCSHALPTSACNGLARKLQGTRVAAKHTRSSAYVCVCVHLKVYIGNNINQLKKLYVNFMEHYIYTNYVFILKSVAATCMYVCMLFCVLFYTRMQHVLIMFLNRYPD